MEFLLLPSHPGSPSEPVEKTPYVCKKRYDGGPFLSYPRRVGKDSALVNQMDWQRSQRVNSTPLADIESFVQTWLYFGFILEFLRVNSPEVANDLPASADESYVDLTSSIGDGLDAPSTNPPTSSPPSSSEEIIDWLYSTIVVRDGDKQYIALNEGDLDELLAKAKSRLPETEDARIKYYHHLFDCLSLAHPILATLPKGSHHAVRYSIGALHELVAQTLRGALQRTGSNFIFGRTWAVNFLNQEAQDSMLAHGWCPSDISRATVKFISLEALQVARMIDKSLPRRDHSRCSDVICTIHQINMDDYQVTHLQDDCRCEELNVQTKYLEEILAKGDGIPLLRLEGDVNNLSVEIVESTVDTPYVAISHVWADGLGNPNANALQRCRLLQLLDWVTAVSNSAITDAENTGHSPLIWLDTLCCPAKDGEGKQKAIEKIRLVYQRARLVLVLDAGLMPYKSKAQELPELVIRIFTSGWFRRLWTLQEGALANLLYFQFADEVISLNKLRDSFVELWTSVRIQIFYLDILQEFWRLEAFFHSERHKVSGKHPDLVVLDQALQYRSVSVATDEPLCIGTLMSLDLGAILQVERESRMQKVWELIAIRRGGIPAQVIFFEEPRLDVRGWRWAPRSLLSIQKGINELNVRMVRWGDPQQGTPTPRGLRLQYPGWYLSVTKYADSKPRQPWPKLKRIPEAYTHFRDQDTGVWYRVSDNHYAVLARDWTDEDRQEYNNLNLFPLHDMADTNKSVIITRKVETSIKTGVFASIAADEVSHSEEEGVAVEMKYPILVAPLAPDDGYIYDVAGRLALQLRADEMTDKHLALHERLAQELGGEAATLDARILENEEFKVSIKDLRQKMRDMMADTLAQDPKLVKAVEKHFGHSFLEDIWILIQDWFNHDYIGKSIADDAVWFVD